MILFSKNHTEKKLLLFIGSPRTGSTLLGQIINYHPNCLVANEFRLLNKIVLDKKDKNKTLKKLKKYALKQFKKGLENDKKYKKTLNQYQKKWKGFEQFTNQKEFEKQEIKIIGDKKAGGNIQIISDYNNPSKMFFQSINNIYFIQIIRNPIDAAISLMKSHNIKDFETAVKQIVSQSINAYSFINKNNYPAHVLYYEDLTESPKLEIKRIFDFLNLEIDLVWLNKISKIISPSEKKEINKVHIETFKSILNNFPETSLFKRYL